MADADDLLIELEEPEIPESGAPEAQKPARAPVEPQDGIAELKAKLERERSGRLAAENAARQHAQTAAQAMGDQQDAETQMVTTALETVKQNATFLEAQYADAMAAQDYGRVAKVQTEMATNAARQLQLENGLEALKSRPKPVPQAPPDPVEQLAQQLSPRSAAWIRSHPECATDPRLFQRMLAAHNIAETDGLQLDSDEYFGRIEEIMGYGRQQPQAQEIPGDEEPLSEAAKPAPRRQAPPAAPPSRGNGASNRVVLTRDQVEAAHFTYPDLTPVEAEKEYARNMLELRKEGKLN